MSRAGGGAWPWSLSAAVSASKTIFSFGPSGRFSFPVARSGGSHATATQVVTVRPLSFTPSSTVSSLKP